MGYYLLYHYIMNQLLFYLLDHIIKQINNYRE